VTKSTELSRAECRTLLAGKSLGRIAFATGDGLRIFPVNYVLHGDRIIFRTLPYGVIARSIRSADVAFEVDEVDEDLRRGWSVLAVGRCERVSDVAELEEIRRDHSPEPWVGGSRELHFSITWKGISGRRIGAE
jgi:nitroimidazol reductase NimA-like FMN-containing flavoprotein (pyridoxamine 5'-phosphate oxidase superfamily)